MAPQRTPRPASRACENPSMTQPFPTTAEHLTPSYLTELIGPQYPGVRIDGNTNLEHARAPNACVRITRSSSAGSVSATV